MARPKGQEEGKNRMRQMDTVKGSRNGTKESGEDGRVKGITGEQGEEERREECGRDEQKR